MGVGWAKSSTGWTYICARFDPTGNMVVTPPGEGEVGGFGSIEHVLFQRPA